MSDFFYEFLLFGAELFTIVAALIILLIAIAAIVSHGKNKKESLIKVEDLNEYYSDLKEEILSNVLEKDDFKKYEKKQKKEEKDNKKKKKHETESDPVRRLYVIRFDGDLHATDVDALRETISAVLTVGTEEDEVLLVMESSGGVVQNYGLAASQLLRIKNKGIKLTIAVDLVAASGGYMMACVADKIIAAPFSVIGSIGVLAQVPNFNKLLEKLDVDIEQHTAGEYKTTLTMLGKNTSKAREKFKEELEDTHELFKTFVSSNRPALDVNKVATGEYWYGTQALELKLIDEITTSDDYIINALDNFSVYEVSQEYHETLKDKLSSILEGGVLKALKKIFAKAASESADNKSKMAIWINTWG